MAQNNEELITLRLRDKTIGEALETINKRYNYTFVLRTPDIDTKQKVSINVRRQKIGDVLDALFSGQDVVFDIANKTVRVSKNVRRQDETPDRTPVARKVTGLVTDGSGEPMVGVSVLVRGSNQGAITDMEGRYEITVDGPGQTLRFSFLGYRPQERKVEENRTLNVTLQEDVQSIDEVVVVGYSVQKKKDITGAISTVLARDIENIPVNDFGSALAGRSAGVQVITPSGKPNEGFSIRVRGATSINAGNEPLYVVDGVPTTDTKSINPSEIESVTILKDASSAAIYGNAGANGVVLITTKKGRKGEAQIELNAYYGFSARAKRIEVLDSDEYLDLLSDLGYPAMDQSVYNAHIDWQDEMFRNAAMQNYQLSISGGTDKSLYYISAGFIKQEGIVKPSSFERVNFKINMEQELKKWIKVGTNLSYSKINDVDVSDGNSETVILQAITTPSVVGRYNADGTFPTLPFLSSLENPLSAVESYTRDYVYHKLLGNLYAEISFSPNLKLKTSMGVEVGASRYKEFLDPFSSAWGRNQQGQASYNTALNYKWINEEILTYTKTFGDHDFSALAGFVASRYVGESANNSIRGFSDNKIQTMNAGTVLDKPSEAYGASSNVSVLARATYDYRDKYLATVNIRADGSSKFSANSRWGYFPSFSLGWRITGEEFMKPLEWLSDLKLRVGWGQVGNDQVGDYSAYGIYGIGANYDLDGVIRPGYYQSQIGNDKLRWERTSQTNLGLDFSFLNGRVSVTADAYYKKTTDLLLMVRLPQSSGFDSGMQNVGSVMNKGLELQLNTHNLTGELKWTTDFNISTNKNEVTDMAGSPAIFTGGLDKKISGNVSIIQKGQPLGSFYGFKAVGVNPADGRMMYEKANGMLVYEESLSADEDRRILGCAQPNFLYGINNTLSYRDFALSFFFQGSYGNDIYNATRMFTEGMFDSRNQSDRVLMRWRSPGDYTTVPRAEKDKYPVISSRFIEDGSYFKLKNVKLSYTLPRRLTRKALMNRVTVYVAGDNLVTFTNYRGYDPEVNIGGGSASAMGIDQGVFPHARTYIVGTTIVF
ncbi:MAG: TonB-dependent receptor [Mediterranea sp.]|nr:TonB-dependent receptor [Mediterranea sp.]